MDKEFEQFRATQGVRSSSDTQRSRDKNIQSQRKAIEKAAYELQIDPIDLATVIDYETGGTFDPWQKGPTTKWGQHRGLIQFGEPQRREFGVYQGQTFDEQITTSVVKYLRQRGVKPGMTFDQVYATVNGGSPNRNRNTPDVGTGRTIQDNINKALSQSRPRVLQRFGWGESVNTEFEAWRQKNTVDTEFEAWRRQRQGSPNVQVQQEQPVNPAFTEQDIANFEERFGVKTTPPTPEPPATLNAQRMAASDPASTRIATLFTQGEAIPDRTPDEVDVPIANGQILRANQQKLAAFMQSTGVTPADMQKPGFDFTPLIGGKAENLGVDGGANAPMAVVTRDANTGAEMVASGITEPNAITYEAGLQRAQFPNQDTVTGLESAQDVAKEREQMTAQNVPPLMGQERLEASFQRTPPEPEYIRRSAAELEAPGVKFFEFEKTGKVGDDLEYLGINEGIHYAEDKLGDKWKLKITGDNGKWERVDPFPAQLTFNNAVYERVGDGKYRSADGQVFDVREEKDKDGNSVFVRVQPPSPSQRVEKRQKVVAQRTQGLAPGEADDVAAANESIARQDAEEQAALARQGVPTQTFRDERGAGISIAIPQGLDQRQANDYVRAELQSRYNVDLPKDWGFLGGYSGSGNVVISADDLRKLGVNVQREESARQRPFQKEIPQGLKMPELPESQAEKEIESRIQSPAYSFQEIMKSGMASLDPRVVGIALANRLWGDEGQTLDRDYVEAEKKRLKDKYGTYGAAWNAEKYFQNMDALETTVRVASQAGRSFLRNLVSGTGKTAAFFDNLAETFGPASILPENLRPSLRNTANALDMAVRILTGAKTLEEARKGYTGASEFDKTTIVKALDEFEKAVGDDPVLKERVLGDLGEGLGSLGAFVALGALMPSMAVGRFTAGKAALKRGMPRLVSGAAVKAGQLPLETAVSGALQTSGKMAQEGKRAGLTENEARLYGGFGVLLGAVEMFGAGRALIHGIKSPIVRGNVVRGVLDAIKAKGRNVIENTGREAGQEFFQEFSQSVGGKSALEFLKDRDARAYDRLVNAVKRLPEQMREAAVNDALIGLLVGGVAGGAGGAIQRVPRETAYKVTETAEAATPVIIDGKGEGVVVEDRGKTVVVDHAPKVNKDGETTYGKRSIERKDRVTPLVEVEQAETVDVIAPNEVETGISEQPARVEAEGDVSAGVGKEQDVEFRPTRLGEGVTAPESRVARGEAGLRPTMEARQDTLEVVPKEGEAVTAEPTRESETIAGTITSKTTPKGIATVNVNELEVDPDRFQYKLNKDAKGSTGSLQGVEQWNPLFAGLVQVWRDPSDGKTYVVNGHNRFNKAVELGQTTLNVQYIDAPDAKTARAAGAKSNIASGDGTAMDAAQYFKDSGETLESIRKEGLPLTTDVAKKGIALANLNDFLFNAARRGELAENYAVAIGSKIDDPDLQNQAFKALSKANERKPVSMAVANEIIEAVNSAPQQIETERTLFGDFDTTTSLFIERAQAAAAIKKRLAEDKSLFGTAARKKDRLAEGGTTVDVEKATELHTSAAEALVVFDKLKNSSGVISDILDASAKAIAGGESLESVARRNYDKIQQAVKEALGKREQTINTGSGSLFEQSDRPESERGVGEGAKGETEIDTLFASAERKLDSDATKPLRSLQDVKNAEAKYGIRIMLFDVRDNPVTSFEDAVEFTAMPGEDYAARVNGKIPKTTFTPEWILGKIASRSDAVSAHQDLIKALPKVPNARYYPATYGFGVEALYRSKDSFEKDTQKIRDFLNKNGIDFREEFSDEHWVYRFVISQAKANINKLKNIGKATDDASVLRQSATPASALDEVYNDDGTVNYDKAKNVAERIRSGELEVVRLDRRGEQGRLVGGQRNVEASVILAANEAASPQAESQRNEGQRLANADILRQAASVEDMFDPATIEAELAKIEPVREKTSVSDIAKWIEENAESAGYRVIEVSGLSENSFGKSQYIRLEGKDDNGKPFTEEIRVSDHGMGAKRKFYTAVYSLEQAERALFPDRYKKVGYKTNDTDKLMLSENEVRPDDEVIRRFTSKKGNPSVEVRRPRSSTRWERISGNYPDLPQGRLLAPNGKPSNLPNERIWKMVRTPAFKAWFGDWINDPASASQVVDENGEPAIVYHGTTSPLDFKAFRAVPNDIGIHFGTIGQANDRLNFLDVRDPRVNQRILPVFLSIGNPLRLRDVGWFDWANVPDALKDTGLFTDSDISQLRRFDDYAADIASDYNEANDIDPDSDNFDYEQSDEYIELQESFREAVHDFLESYGYDGVVYKNTGETAGGIEFARKLEDAKKSVFAKYNFTGGAVPEAMAKSPEYQDYNNLRKEYEAFREQNAEDSYIAFTPNQIKSIFNRGTFSPDDASILRQSASVAQPFYSRVESIIADKMPNKATPAQVAALLAKNGVKELDPEFQAMKLWLEGKDSVSKAEVVEFAEANRTVVGEVVKGSNLVNKDIDILREAGIEIERNESDPNSPLGFFFNGDFIDSAEARDAVKTGEITQEVADAIKRLEEADDDRTTTKFDQWQLPGESENYREEFLTAPPQSVEKAAQAVKDFEKQFNSKPIPEDRKAEWERLRQAVADAKGWKDGHDAYDDVTNPIARARYNDRTTIDGDKMLFAEEIQQPSKDNLAKMPKVYSKFGEEMMIRKLLYRAALGGYDYFGFTTGEQQADRYDLSKHISNVNAGKGTDGKYHLQIRDKGGNIVDDKHLTAEELPNYIGKDLAQKILDHPDVEAGFSTDFSGLDLKVGGEGLKRRYDRKHVDYINKLMKPYGVQVESKEIATNNGETETVHVVRISPEFKAAVEASIRDNGGAFPLFKARDAESAAYLTKTLPKVATPDLMREVSSAIQPDAMLEVNEEGSEFLRRVFNTIGQGSGEFFGALLPKSILQKASDRIKVYARDMEKAGWTKDDLKPIRDLAKNLGTLAKNPDAIVYVYDDALPEETHHRLVTQAGGISADAIARLKESPLWKSERFDKEYPNASDTVRAIELAAKIETGQDYWKGKATNAQKVAFLRTVADSIIDANTVDGVLTLDPQYFERVLRYGTDTQSNIGRTAANEQDAARGERIDEGGREAGEAERDQGRETGRESDVGARRDTESGVREDAEDAGLEAARPKAPSLKEKRPGKTGLDVDAERLTEAQKKKQKVAAISRVLGIEVYYDPQSREETERKAAELTANVGVSAAIEKALAPNASAEGMFIVYKELDRLAALYDFYTREGRGAEAAVIGDAYASLLTRTAERQIQTGREVEVAKVLTSASPSLALLAAERRIKTQLGDDATLSDDQRQTILVLQTEISDLTGKYEDAARRLRNAQATINRIKSEKALEPQTVTAAKGTQQKLLKEYKERESEILQKLHDLFPNAPAFTAEPEILRMAAVSDDVLSRYDGTLTPEQAQVAIDFTVGQVLQGSDYGQVMGALQQLGVSETDAKWLHFDAIQLIRPSKDDITSANKEKRQAAVKTRREHYKQADAFGSPEKAIARAIKNVKASIERLTAQIESGEVTTAKPAKSEQASSPELEALRKKQKELQKEVAQKRKELKRLQRAEAVQEWKLSGIAQDALKNDAYKDNDALIKAIDYLTNVRVGKEGRSLNGLINLIRATDPSLSMRDAELLASDAKKAVKALRDERQRIKDEANNISNEARAEMNRLRVERTKAARRMSAHLMSIGRQNEWAMKRINNLLRGLFVNNYGTQLFNAVQSAGVSMPAKMILDLFDAGLQTITVNAGENAEIRAKDVLLPWAYIAANNKQLASEALAYFPEEYYRVHAGILGDIEIDKLPQGQTAPASTAWLHTAIDTADVGLSKLSRISGAKWQEMHFRNAMVAARFDQTVRAKTKGKKSLLDAMQDGTLKDYITEKDAMRAADDALEVTFASEINDPIGRKLKEAYDYLDNFVPLILNPVTYARFTYTTTKVMVMNPLLFGMLDAQWAGGRGYNNQSIAKAVLGWMGVAVAWGLMSALGGDDDRWDTLFVLGEDQPPVSVKRFFPLSSYFYIAHLIDNAARGGTMPSRKEILEGLASLETDYFMYGPGIDLFTTVKEWGYDGTREIGDVGRATSRLLGNYAAAATRFVSPFRTVWAQIDKEESALRKQSDSASSAFLSELARSVPGVTRAVGEKQLDVVAEEPIYQPFPLGRLVGLNLVHPSFLKAKDSPATQQANNQFSKTFPSEGRMTAEERELYSIRRQLREGVRRGIITSDAADARAIKYLADRVSGQSLSRLRSDLRRSELQSTLHWNFAMVKNPKTDLDIKKNETALRKLRKVWAVATRQEKDEMLQVLQKKQLPNNVLQELR